MSDEEERTPVDVALDLLFYAPLGLVVTATEELPKLAEKGRRQFTTARVVGQFAVGHARKQAERRFGGGARPAATTRPPVVADPVGTEPPGGSATTEPPGGRAPGIADPSERVAAAAGVTADEAAAPRATPPAAPVAVDDLAIPGYDSLSASQVVQRLAGLAPAELDAVRRYEAATRGRRTILTRATQLQES